MPKHGVCGAMGIRLLKNSEISVYKSVLRALRCPSHLHFWWDERERLLYVTGANEQTPYSIPVSDGYYRHRSGLKFRNVGLYRAIQNFFGRNAESETNLVGRAFLHQGMVIFKPEDELKGVHSHG
jgi:hypothetical protein